MIMCISRIRFILFPGLRTKENHFNSCSIQMAVMDGEETRQLIQEMKPINSGFQISSENKDLTFSKQTGGIQKSLCLFIIDLAEYTDFGGDFNQS